MDDLVKRLEAATGADRELDAAVAVASGQYVADRHRPGMFFKSGNKTASGYGVPTYTASIDSALTLVPEGWGFSVEMERPTKMATAAISPPGCEPWGPKSIDAEGYTPALALCIAALRALQDRKP